MKNLKIRQRAKERGVFLWEIATALNIGEATITRKLRKELSADETAHILGIIEQIAAEKA